MATLSIAETQPGEQPSAHADQHWEEDCYQWGCTMARQEAMRRLEALEHRLQAQRPATWTHKGWAEREVGRWCRRPRRSSEPCGAPMMVRRGPQPRREPPGWLQARVPAFTGPHASRPWVKVLRHLAHDSFPIN